MCIWMAQTKFRLAGEWENNTNIFGTCVYVFCAHGHGELAFAYILYISLVEKNAPNTRECANKFPQYAIPASSILSSAQKPSVHSDLPIPNHLPSRSPHTCIV